MKWLRASAIQKAANESDEAAIRCAITHWEQIVDASEKELARKLNRDRTHFGVSGCAMCLRFLSITPTNRNKSSRCKLCPLTSSGSRRCYRIDSCTVEGSLYNVAMQHMNEWHRRKEGDMKMEAWREHKRTAMNMLVDLNKTLVLFMEKEK